MAEVTDLQRLVVSLEANVKKYERELARANGEATKRTREIQNRFNRLNSGVGAQLTALAGKLGLVFGGAALLRGAQQMVDAGTRIENALKVAGLAGDELTKVYDRLFSSAQRNAAPIESLVELYSRAALVQKELNVSTEELLNFTDKVAVALRVSGKSAQESSGALLQLSQALGSGVVRAEEFNSILEGALPIAQAAAAGLEEAGGSVAKLRTLVIQGKVSSEAFFRAFEAGSGILEEKVASAELTVSQGFVQLQNTLIDAAGRMNDASGAGKTLAGVMGAIAEGIASVTAKGGTLETTLSRTRDEFNELGAAARELWNDPSFNNLLRFLLGNLSGVPAPRKPLEITIDKPGGDANDPGKPKPSIKDHPVPGGAGGRENSYEREIRQMQERTKYLDLERELIGASNLARDKALATEELQNAALQAKIPLNETIRQQIEQTAEAYAMAAEKAREATDKQQAIIELQQEFGNMAASSIKGLIDGTKSLNDVLQDVLSTLADLFIQSALLGQGPLASLFGTGAKGGGVGGIIGALFGGGRASGGPVSGNRAYVVGERGPELFYPGRSGAITPNNAIGGGGGGTVVNVINNASGVQATQNKRRGPDGRDIVDIVVAEVGRKIGEGGYDKQLDGRYGVAPRRVAR